MHSWPCWIALICGLLSTGCSRYTYQEPPELHSRRTKEQHLVECEGHARRTVEAMPAEYWAAAPFSKEQSVVMERDECMAARGWRKKRR